MTIIRQFESQKVDNSLKLKKVSIILTICMIFLILVEIWMNNRQVVYGGKFEEMSRLQQSLKLENQILENEIAKEASLINIASKSASLGFSKPKKVSYLH